MRPSPLSPLITLSCVQQRFAPSLPKGLSAACFLTPVVFSCLSIVLPLCPARTAAPMCKHIHSDHMVHPSLADPPPLSPAHSPTLLMLFEPFTLTTLFLLPNPAFRRSTTCTSGPWNTSTTTPSCTYSRPSITAASAVTTAWSRCTSQRQRSGVRTSFGGCVPEQSSFRFVCVGS